MKQKLETQETPVKPSIILDMVREIQYRIDVAHERVKNIHDIFYSPHDLLRDKEACKPPTTPNDPFLHTMWEKLHGTLDQLDRLTDYLNMFEGKLRTPEEGNKRKSKIDKI